MLPLPWAPRRAYASDLFPASATGFTNNAIANAYGIQADFHLLTQGETDEGLRIITERATYPTDQLNGLRVIVRTESPTAATLDVSAGTLTIDVASSTTGLNTVKARVDAVTGLTSAYFGTETGSGRPTRGEGAFDGGVRDEAVVMRILPDGTVLMFVGAAAPTDTSECAMIRPGLFAPHYTIPAGQLVWLRAVGASNVDGSIEVWRLNEAAESFPIPVNPRGF